MARVKADELQPDWWSKSLAGGLAGLALAFALSSLLVQMVGVDEKDVAQFAMWIVPPIWMTVFAFIYLFKTGLRAWLWLVGANAIAYVMLIAMRATGG